VEERDRQSLTDDFLQYEDNLCENKRKISIRLIFSTEKRYLHRNAKQVPPN
jgi:hypothetical protein